MWVSYCRSLSCHLLSNSNRCVAFSHFRTSLWENVKELCVATITINKKLVFFLGFSASTKFIGIKECIQVYDGWQNIISYTLHVFLVRSVDRNPWVITSIFGLPLRSICVIVFITIRFELVTYFNPPTLTRLLSLAPPFASRWQTVQTRKQNSGAYLNRMPKETTQDY